MPNLQRLHLHMVDAHLARRGITNAAVLNAFRGVAREDFVPEELTPFAYEDAPLPIGEGQTISQPYVVALTIQELGLRGGERVLEVGNRIRICGGDSQPHRERSLYDRARPRAGRVRRGAARSARVRQCSRHVRRRLAGLARARSLRRDCGRRRGTEAAAGAPFAAGARGKSRDSGGRQRVVPSPGADRSGRRDAIPA